MSKKNIILKSIINDKNKKFSDYTMKDKFNMVGKKIPEFNLPNSRGETVAVENFQGNNNVVVIVLRRSR